MSVEARGQPDAGWLAATLSCLLVGYLMYNLINSAKSDDFFKDFNKIDKNIYYRIREVRKIVLHHISINCI